MGDELDDAVDRFYVDAGRRIRDARSAANVTQAQLGAAASMTRSSIANLEAGRQRIAIHTLVLIAATLGTDLSELISPSLVLGGPTVLTGLSEKLAGESSTTREFVQGAIAQLGLLPGKGEE